MPSGAIEKRKRPLLAPSCHVAKELDALHRPVGHRAAIIRAGDDALWRLFERHHEDVAGTPTRPVRDVRFQATTRRLPRSIRQLREHGERSGFGYLCMAAIYEPESGGTKQ